MNIQSHMNESCLIWMSRVTHEWVMSYMDESCHIWLSHVFCEWVMPRINESCHTWMSHVTYEWVTSDMNKSCFIWMSCHIWMSHVLYEWVVSQLNESCHYVQSQLSWLLSIFPIWTSISRIYHFLKFSKVSSLLILPCQITDELTFQKFCQRDIQFQEQPIPRNSQRSARYSFNYIILLMSWCFRNSDSGISNSRNSQCQEILESQFATHLTTLNHWGADVWEILPVGYPIPQNSWFQEILKVQLATHQST